MLWHIHIVVNNLNYLNLEALQLCVVCVCLCASVFLIILQRKRLREE